MKVINQSNQSVLADLPLDVLQRDVLQNSVVVFSKNYLPMARVNIRRAAVLLVTERAEPMQLSDGPAWELRSPSLVLQVPQQIRMRISANGSNSRERTWKPPSVSRREVLKRDRSTCQYCGSKRKLTIDHIMPQSRGGQHRWDNVVIACEPCNQFKGARTPEEAKMTLLNKPKAPSHPVIAFAENFWQRIETKDDF